MDDDQKELQSTLTHKALTLHQYRGDALYLVVLEDIKTQQRIYPIISEQQGLTYIPTGGGGTRWPQDPR